MENSLYRLVALCARAECRPAHHARLAALAETVSDWRPLPALAKREGMGPLVYRHLRDAGVTLPPDVAVELRGLALHTRLANHALLAALEELLAAFEGAGIAAIVLKGAALAHLVYPEPGLRPMADLDLLIAHADAVRALDALRGLGFRVPAVSAEVPHRHLPIATRNDDGFPVQVELHLRLLSSYLDHARFHLVHALRPGARRALRAAWARPSHAPGGTLEELTVPPRPFPLGARTAYALGDADMLQHLCEHLISHVNVWDNGMLIWAADVVSAAERFGAEVDWAWLRRWRPGILETLALVHCLTPLSDELIERAPLRVGPPPAGIGAAYRGWPRMRWARGRRWRVLAETLAPPEWWLRLRYRVGPARGTTWLRLVRHPWHIAGHLVRRGLEELGWPSPQQLAQARPAEAEGAVPPSPPAPAAAAPEPEPLAGAGPRQRPGFRLEELDGEWVLHHPGRATVIQLNPSAALIWDACDGRHSVEEIAELLAAELEAEGVAVDAGVLAADVAETVERLAALGALARER